MTEKQKAWDEVAKSVIAIQEACNELGYSNETSIALVAELFLLLIQRYSSLPNPDVSEYLAKESFANCVVALDKVELLSEAGLYE